MKQPCSLWLADRVAQGQQCAGDEMAAVASDDVLLHAATVADGICERPMLATCDAAGPLAEAGTGYCWHRVPIGGSGGETCESDATQAASASLQP